MVGAATFDDLSADFSGTAADVEVEVEGAKDTLLDDFWLVVLAGAVAAGVACAGAGAGACAGAGAGAAAGVGKTGCRLCGVGLLGAPMLKATRGLPLTWLLMGAAGGEMMRSAAAEAEAASRMEVKLEALGLKVP